MMCTLQFLRIDRTVFHLIAVLIVVPLLSLQAQAQIVAELCLDPLAWTCAAEYGNVVDNHGCGGSTCFQQGNDWVCDDPFPTEAGGAFGGAFTSGVEPPLGNNGKEVTGTPVFKVCIWQNACWEYCVITPGLPSPECSSDYLPPIPLGGFDITFGNDCPAP
jgi:hypothetical protein